MKNCKGITLVALVITIVVLLILSAVVVGTFSQNSVIGKAKSAKEETKIGEEKELIELAKIEWGGGTSESGNIYFRDYLTSKLSGKATVKRISGGNLEVTYKDSGNIYTIKEEGVSSLSSGKAGDKASWTLYDDGELHYFGEGKVTGGPSTDLYNKITKIVFDEGITDIQCSFYARYNPMGGVTDVYIPSTVTNMYKFAFRNDGINNANIRFGGTLEQAYKVGIWAFSGVWTTPTYSWYINYDELVQGNVIIPTSIKSTGNYFLGYSKDEFNLIYSEGNETAGIGERWILVLKKVELSSTITSLTTEAFYFASNLTLLDCRKCVQIPTYGNLAVNTSNSKLKIVVPDDLYEDWKAADGWTNVASKIVKASDYNE